MARRRAASSGTPFRWATAGDGRSLLDGGAVGDLGSFVFNTEAHGLRVVTPAPVTTQAAAKKPRQ
jgi:hypothetical protein